VLAALDRVVQGALLLVHAALLLWALVGFAELSFADVPWRRLSNPLFSRPLLALQWTLIAAASVTLLVGFALRFPYTPAAMAGWYGAMAVTCAYQTFFILTDPGRFRAMAIEYLEYATVLAYLFLSQSMRARFG
jgi:hypothetical protein